MLVSSKAVTLKKYEYTQGLVLKGLNFVLVDIGILDIRKLGDMLYSRNCKWFNNYTNMNTYFW